MPPRPFFIDSQVFDKIAGDLVAAALIRRLVQQGVIEILVTHVQEDEIAAIPDVRKRNRLANAVPRRVVPTHGAVYDVSKYGLARYTSGPVRRDLTAIQRRNKARDALIGVTAKWDGATLVVEDRKFRADASAQGVAVMDWPQFHAHLRAI